MKKTEEKLTRRDWIKSGSLALFSTIGGVVAAKHVSGDGKKPQKGGQRLAMLIDMRRCTGCMACVVSCKAENGVRLGGFRTWVSDKEIGRYPAVTRHFLPRLCNHCQNPPCLDVCPTGATFKRPDGLVDIDKSKCIGCRHCMGACPYQSRYFNPTHDPQEESQFPAATHGTVDKCNFCAHRVDEGVVPACVNTCPAEARVFGDLDDPESEIRRRCSKESVMTLLAEMGTEPSVLYVGGDPNLFRESGRSPST